MFTRRIRDADYAIRSEWVEVSKINYVLPLADVIDLVSNRNNLWPRFSETKPAQHAPVVPGTTRRNVVMRIARLRTGSFGCLIIGGSRRYDSFLVLSSR